MDDLTLAQISKEAGCGVCKVPVRQPKCPSSWRYPKRAQWKKVWEECEYRCHQHKDGTGCGTDEVTWRKQTEKSTKDQFLKKASS